MRKIVYWHNQKVREAFQHTEVRGWYPVPLCVSQWWERETYEFYEITATDEQFATRKDGCVCG
jgi:hypothetical protein